jgi:uncharacterized membrane protein
VALLEKLTAPTTGLPRWVVPSTLGLGRAGLGVSIYLTVEHITSPDRLACPIGDSTSCTTVTTSAQSRFLGIPVAVLGLVFFVAMLIMCLPGLWAMPGRRLWQARLAAAGLGMAFVLYLIFSEIFLIEAICTWCTIVHVITFALFAVIVWATAVADPNPFDPQR